MFFYQISTLTTGKDNFPGTALDDMFAAENAGVGGQTHTLTTGDILDGGNGNDTLVLNDQGNVSAGLQTVKNIENLKVYESGDAVNAWTGDVSEFAGLQNVEVTATGAVTLTAGASVTNVALNGAAGATLTGNGITSVSAQHMASATTSNTGLTIENTTADHTLNVALDKVGKYVDSTHGNLAIIDATAATIALTSNGVENAVLINANSAALKNIVINGKGDLTLTAGDTTATSIDGAKAEGDLTLGTLAAATATITTGAGDDSFTTGAIKTKATINTGAGNDKVTLATGAVLTAGSTITLGDGDDTLTMNFADLTKDLKIEAGTHTADGGDALIFNAATGGAAATFTKDQYALVKDSGFEVFGATTGGDLTADASQLGVKDFYVENTGALHLDRMANGSNVMLSAGEMTSATGVIGASVLTMAKTGDTLNLVLEKVGALGADAKTGVTTDAHTINVLSDADSAASGADVNELKLTTGANASVVLTGSQELTYTNGANVTQTIKAEGFEGKLTVTGATDVDTIYAGTGGSIIDSKAGSDKITLGAGVDTVNFTVSTGTDEISSFTTASDKMHFAGITLAGGGTIAAVTGTAVTSGTVTANALTTNTIYVISDGGTGLTAADTAGITSYTTMSAVATYLGKGYNATADNNAAIFVINDLAGDKSYVYLFDETESSASTIQEADLKLIGVVTESANAALVAGDIA